MRGFEADGGGGWQLDADWELKFEGAGDGWGVGVGSLLLIIAEDLGIWLSPTDSAQAALLAAREHCWDWENKPLKMKMGRGGGGWSL
jgi:hypothetical protein